MDEGSAGLNERRRPARRWVSSLVRRSRSSRSRASGFAWSVGGATPLRPARRRAVHAEGVERLPGAPPLHGSLPRGYGETFDPTWPIVISSGTAGAQRRRPGRRSSNSPEPPQTPVSGRTSSTRAAASWSPAISATTLRHLLVPGHGQERRCAAVGLHADQVEVAARAGGAASHRGGRRSRRSGRRVDLGREGAGGRTARRRGRGGWTSESRVVGPEAGDATTSSTSVTRCPSRSTPGQRTVGLLLDASRTERGRGGDGAALGGALGGACRAPPRASSWSLSPPPKALPDARAADQPGDPGAGVRLGEAGELDEGVLGGGSRAGDDDVLAGVPLPARLAAEVGDAVADPVGVRGLAERRQAVAAERVGSAPGAGGVDDGRGGDALDAVAGVGPGGRAARSSRPESTRRSRRAGCTPTTRWP